MYDKSNLFSWSLYQLKIPQNIFSVSSGLNVKVRGWKFVRNTLDFDLLGVLWHIWNLLQITSFRVAPICLNYSINGTEDGFSSFLGLSRGCAIFGVFRFVLEVCGKGVSNGLCEHASSAFIFASTIVQLSILSREQRALKKL